MTPRPGSVAWLMRHELRLYWRSGTQVGSLIFLIIVQLLLHAIAVGMALALQTGAIQPLPRRMVVLVITAGLAFALLIMTSRALTAAIQALYTRADLDLLLSSPVAPNSVVAVRAAAIALGVTGEQALLLWPFANVFVLFGQYAWLKAYLLLPALAMLATSMALLLMVALFRLLGPRRTRVFVQVAAAALGMSFVMLAQLPNMMRRSDRADSGGGIERELETALAGPLWLPAQQVMNGYVPTVLFIAASLSILMLTVRSIRNRFIDASTLVAGVSRAATTRVRSTTLQFRHGLRRVLITKELRLIARDPWLLTQMLGQFVFVLPLGLMMWRQGASGIPWAWLGIIFVCGSMVSSLAWLTVSAEDSPELLASSPVSAATIVRTKIEAALLPVVPLLVVPVVALWHSHPEFGLLLAVCSAGAGISCALLQIRNPVARKRADFQRRHKGRGLSGLVETAVIALWVLLCALVARVA